MSGEPTPSPFSVIVVPHTHWDPEWYQSATRVRQRLVPLLDDVLATLDAEPDIRFTLDGQTLPLEDYLAIRPEEASRIRHHVVTGRLVVGPWYVLADELLCGGETLVRNLLAGRRMGNQFGGWQEIGYSPDAFGHPEALPGVLREFGVDRAIVWRGYGGEPGQERDLFWWTGPDGSRVLVYHLPPDGYEFGAELPVDTEGLRARWARVKSVLQARAATSTLLVLNGADHHALQPDLTAVMERLSEVDPDSRFVLGTLDDFFDAVGADPPAPEVAGELRFSYRYTWTLQGVHSTRASIKRAMAEAEHCLVRWAEPQAALAAVAGGRDRAPLLTAGWRDHLRGCAHDSIGGCGADVVARDVRVRSEHVLDGAIAIGTDALWERVGEDPSRSRRAREAWTPTVFVVNPSPTPRGGVVRTDLTFMHSPVAVGKPGVTTTNSRPPVYPRLTGPDGAEVPIQILDRRIDHERLDSPRDYPAQDVVERIAVALWVDDVAPLGVSPLAVGEGEDAPPLQVGGVEYGEDWIETTGLRVSGAATAGFTVTVGGASFAGLGSMVSERDDGDTYTFQSLPGDAPIPATWGPARFEQTGPLVGTLARDFVVSARASGTVRVSLERGNEVVRVEVVGENHAGNHRLRMHVPAPPGRSKQSIADMHFGPVRRMAGSPRPEDFPREWPVSTAPFHRYVVAIGGSGTTVCARGPYEYEDLGDVVAVTIVRAVGELSKGDLDARPGHAGWPAPTPDAQEIGPFAATLGWLGFGVTDNAPPEAWARLERAVETHHEPLEGVMCRWALAPSPPVSGPRLTGDGLVFHALKSADVGSAVVLRCANVTDQTVRGTWIWPTRISRAARGRLDESEGEPLVLDPTGTQVSFAASPRAVVTVLVWV